LVVQLPAPVHAVPALAEFALQTPLRVGQLAFDVQAAPETLQVPVPVTGQLALDVQAVPDTLHVPASVGQLALDVHAAPLMLQVPPTIAQLFGEVVQAAPAALPPQRLVVVQLPVALQSVPVMLQVRPVFGHAVDEQSAPDTLHFFTAEHWPADVQAVPVLLQVPETVGQLVAALAAVHDAPLILHLPMSVQTLVLLVQSRPEMLHFLLHV
jgi:hypothetical protein